MILRPNRGVQGNSEERGSGSFDGERETDYYSVTPMPRTTDTMTISLAPEMLEEVDCVCKEEHRTRSELVREALRQYFAMRAGGDVIHREPAGKQSLRKRD